MLPLARGLSEPSLLSPDVYFSRERGKYCSSTWGGSVRCVGTFSTRCISLLCPWTSSTDHPPTDSICYSLRYSRSSSSRTLFASDDHERLLWIGFQLSDSTEQTGATARCRFHAEWFGNQCAHPTWLHLRGCLRKAQPRQWWDHLLSTVVIVTPVIRLEPNLRRKIRVNFINAVGLDEAGVDGGGLFREFMNELLKTSFNPIRGLFKLTSDGYLYPNPNVAFIYENFSSDFYFLGRILGKVRAKEVNKLFHSLFASVLGYLREISSWTTVCNLLSPEDSFAHIGQSRYTSSGFVRSWNVQKFTLSENLRWQRRRLRLGFHHCQQRDRSNSGTRRAFVDDLSKSDRFRSSIWNRMVEISLWPTRIVLNTSISWQTINWTNRSMNKCCGFVKVWAMWSTSSGYECSMPMSWEYWFPVHREKSMWAIGEIIVNIEVEYRRRWIWTRSASCHSLAPYNKEHPLIQAFWRCVHEFTDEQKRKLLKFTTSCSRPPLFGFKVTVDMERWLSLMRVIRSIFRNSILSFAFNQPVQK